ncbi:MAG: ABC transporter substrate-binding protein [Chloroflexi bacterium]|nr:ABC transporter substrate-binding protein [Chloroflexota bacterium]
MVKGGVDVIGSMATGEVDVAGIAATPGFYNATMRDVPIKIVADKSHLAPGQPFMSLVVRKDIAGDIKEVRDLKGKTVAVNAIETGSAGSSIFLRVLKAAGLSLSDIKPVDLAFPEMNVAMENKSIDVALQIEPLATVGINQGIFVRWKGFDEFSPKHQISGLFYSPKFAKTEAAKGFMLAYLKGVRDFNDGLNKKKGWNEIVPILQEYAAIKDSSLFDKMAYAGLDPDGQLNIESMSEDLKSYSEQGFLKEKPDLNKVIDLQFVEYAIARLGKYQK